MAAPNDPFASVTPSKNVVDEETEEANQALEELSAIFEAATRRRAKSFPIEQLPEVITNYGKTPAGADQQDSGNQADAAQKARKAQTPGDSPTVTSGVPADQRQPAPDPFASITRFEPFDEYLAKNPVLKTRWPVLEGTQREKIINSFATEYANRRIQEALARDKALAKKLSKLKATDRNRILTVLFKREQARAKLKLAPYVYGIDQPEEVERDFVLSAEKSIRRALGPKALTEPEEMLGAFQEWLRKDRLVRERWMSPVSTTKDHERIVKAFIASDIVTPQLEALRQTPFYKSLAPKQRKQAEKVLQDYIEAKATRAFLGVIGNYDFPVVDEPLERTTAKKPSNDPGFLKAVVGTAIGSVHKGIADTIAGAATIVGAGDSSVAKWAREWSETAQRVIDEYTPSDVQQTYAAMQQKLDEGKPFSAFGELASSPKTAALLTTSVFGQLAGGGGVGGLAGKATGFVVAKAGGKALSKRATQGGFISGVAASQGKEYGDQAYTQVMNTDVDVIKRSPLWPQAEQQLRITLGRQPTDAEVKELLARSARDLTARWGAGISAASLILLGSVNEALVGRLLGAGTTSKATGFVSGALTEARQEFVESGGGAAAAEGAASYYTTGQANVDAMIDKVLTEGTFGALVGGTIGGAIGTATNLTTPPAAADGQETPGGGPQTPAGEQGTPAGGPQTPAGDPDIDRALQASREQAAIMTLQALQMAGIDSVINAKDIDLNDIDYTIRQDGKRTIVFETGGKQLYKEGEQWFWDGKEVDPMEDPGVAAIIAGSQLRNGRFDEPFVKEAEAAAATAAREDTADVVDETVVDLQEEADAVAGREYAEPLRLHPGEKIILDNRPDSEVADIVGGYIKMLMESGEPAALARKSAVATFGAKTVTKALRTWMNERGARTIDDIANRVDLNALKIEAEELYGLKADAKRLTRVQNQLRRAGMHGVIVVPSAADWPGMAPDMPVATYRINGGTDQVTVVNAGAISPRQNAAKLVMAYEAARRVLAGHNNTVTLYQAAVETMMRLPAQGFSMTVKDKKGRERVVDITAAKAERALTQDKKGDLTVKKTATSDRVLKWYYDRLAEGDPVALQALKRILRDTSPKNNIGRLSLSELYRILVEENLIPRSDEAVIISAPPGARASAPPRDPGDNGRNSNASDATQHVSRGAADAAAVIDGNRKAGKKSDKNIAPVKLSLGEWTDRVLETMDGMWKLSVLEGVAKNLEDTDPKKDPMLRFVAALRARQARMNRYMNEVVSYNKQLDILIEDLAQQFGWPDKDTLAQEYSMWRVAQHALERNPVMWAIHTPLRSEEAYEKRQVLMDQVMKGMGVEQALQELIQLARDEATNHPDTIYAGMSNAEAEAVINAARNAGKDAVFERIDKAMEPLVRRILEWREEAGIYAGPAKHVVEAYGWKYYTPLIDIQAQRDKFSTTEDTALSLENLMITRKRRGPKPKDTAEQRTAIDWNTYNVLEAFYIESRNAAAHAANVKVGEAALRFMQAQKDNLEYGLVEEVGKLEYRSRPSDSQNPGFVIPDVKSKDVRIMYVYDRNDGVWKRIRFFDPDLGKYVHNELEDFAFTQKSIVRKIGAFTRLTGRGLTTYRPAFWYTNTVRDLIQTGILAWSQQGLDPIKFSKETVARLASIASKKNYLLNMAKFIKADEVTRRKLAQDPEFVSQPGMKYLVERWENDGLIVFSDYIAEIGTQLERAPTLGVLRRGFGVTRELIDKVEDNPRLHKFMQVIGEGPDVVMSVLDNLHRQIMYDMLRENGVDAQMAAHMARSLMDFNRSSKAGRLLNQFYMFSMAGMTGISTFATNHMWKTGAMPIRIVDGRTVLDKELAIQTFNYPAAAVLMLAGAITALTGYMLMGEDDEGKPIADGIRPSTWMNYVILPFGTTGPDGDTLSPVKIPLQYGLSQLFYGFGTMLGLLAVGRDFKEVFYGYANHLLKNFVPVGQVHLPTELQSGEPLQPSDITKQLVVGMAPTIGSPLAQIAMNKNVFGGQVHQEKTGFGQDQVNLHMRGFIGTPQLWEDMAKFANTWSSEMGFGEVFYPEDIETIVRDYVPILGPFLTQSARAWINWLERPDRSWVEKALTSGLTPLPGLILDHRYNFYEVHNKLRARYIRPAQLMEYRIRDLRIEREKAEAKRRLYEMYPYYRDIKALDRRYNSLLKQLRLEAKKYRRQGQHEKAEEAWLKYIDLQKERLQKMVRILDRYGVLDD